MPSASARSRKAGSNVPARAQLPRYVVWKRKSLFVGKGENIDGKRRPAARHPHRSIGLDGHQDAEQAVVAAGIAHAVEVAPEQQRRSVRVAAVESAAQVADGVDTGLHPRVVHPSGERLPGGERRRGAIRPGDAAGLLGELGERVAAGHDPRRPRRQTERRRARDASCHGRSSRPRARRGGAHGSWLRGRRCRSG